MPTFAANSTDMPKNKNALSRFMILDKMLSDRHHYYDMHDLTLKCNEQLIEADLPTVTKRCIEKDIVDMELPPFRAPIERYSRDGHTYLRYAKADFSIFRKELSEEERHLLREVLNTIGQFEGLTHFEWLDRLQQSLQIEEQARIISFDNNPYLQNANLLGKIFELISNKIVIKITFHTFVNQQQRDQIVHPYLLKQYNNRWFLIGATDEENKIGNFPLDRIDVVTPLPGTTYRPCPEDLKERFEDIVGITLHKNKPAEQIVFWVSNKSNGYVKTKPIHASQIDYKGEKDAELREQYPKLVQGTFFSIKCIHNYELIRELCSFGKELLVLSPSSIQDEIYIALQAMLTNYSDLRT